MQKVMSWRKEGESDRHTLTGGVEAALTTKETFLEEDWRGLAPRTCLAASAEEAMDEEEIKACAAIFLDSVIVSLDYLVKAIIIIILKQVVAKPKPPRLLWARKRGMKLWWRVELLYIDDKTRILLSNGDNTCGFITWIRDILVSGWAAQLKCPMIFIHLDQDGFCFFICDLNNTEKDLLLVHSCTLYLILIYAMVSYPFHDYSYFGVCYLIHKFELEFYLK